MGRWTFYRSWHLVGGGTSYNAYRHGVRMSANSLELIKVMIDLKAKDDPFTYTH